MNTKVKKYDLKAALSLQRRSNFNLETEAYWKDKKRIQEEINNCKTSPPIYLSLDL